MRFDDHDTISADPNQIDSNVDILEAYLIVYSVKIGIVQIMCAVWPDDIKP